MTARPFLSLSDVLALKPAQVAVLLGISRSKVYELMADGALPTISVYPGGPKRITRDALHAYLAERTRIAQNQQRA